MSEKVIVGAHPWVYAAKQPKHDIYPIIEGIFDDMKYAGFEGIELMHNVLYHDDAVEKIALLSERCSLPIIGTSFGGNMWNRDEHDEILETAKTVIRKVAQLGGHTLGTSTGATREKKTKEQLDAQAELLKKIMDVCDKHGVTLNLHNHTYEVKDDEYELSNMIERIPDVKLGPDLNWLYRAGIDPVDFIKRHADRIVFLHLRDEKKEGGWPEAMGEGDMDYVAIGNALREIGFSGEAVVELAHEKDFHLTRPLRESLKMSREYVRQTLGY